jgi:ubiquinone/menaquinone biosynthesis C-methylase UbiE/uncharacterized protein with ATP-grasp and redox domains
MKSVSPSDVFKISNDSIEQYMDIFLCDNSENTSYLRIISSESFKPTSFTIRDRSSNPCYLHETENNFDEWCNELIFDQLQRISESEGIRFDDIKKVASTIIDNLRYILEYDVHGIKLQETIWNQEFIDVLRRVIGFSLTGDPNTNLQTHLLFNELTKKIMPNVINKIKQENLDLMTLLKLATISGLSGLDLKGANAAASSFSQQGILMAPYLNIPLEESVQIYYEEIMRRLDSPTPIFHWERFLQDISIKHGTVKIAWFTDDYIETFFDLFFINNLLDKYPNITLTVIPKNGIHGNDASWFDVIDLLTLDIFNKLNLYEKSTRFSICKSGPSMGAINLRKLSSVVVDIIEEANFVVIKGCRAHEMIQGGLNKPSFTMYAVSREFSESLTGYDARKSPLLFFYLSPGEYAFYGFKDRHLREKVLPDGRKVYLCRSTLEDHERRRKMSNPNNLVMELRNLQTELLLDEVSEPELKEANQVAEKLLDITKKTYDDISESYAISRGSEPHEVDKKIWKKLLDIARIRVKSGKLGNIGDCLTLLDVGTGSGRDIKYASKIPDLKIIGIDNSDGFIRILIELENKNEIPHGSFRKVDMRDLSCFPDGSFDIARYNASLIHLPVIGNGYMIDLALSEGYRVLKENGLIYISVKEGNGLKYVDTEEGLGGRIFQFHTMETIKKIICRNGFKIISAWKGPSSRGEKMIWISIIAEKISY